MILKKNILYKFANKIEFIKKLAFQKLRYKTHLKEHTEKVFKMFIDVKNHKNLYKDYIVNSLYKTLNNFRKITTYFKLIGASIV